MADGPYRFHPGPFFSQHHGRNHNRATSPQPNRRPFTHDTPSPSRSPASAAMVHNFGAYSQNGFQQQHIMNGGQNHQRYNVNGMHLPKQQHVFHHNQHHNAQQHGGQIGHQHNISGGAFQSGTPHLNNYGHDQLQNGAGDDGLDDNYNNNEYWQEQQRWFDETRDTSEGHQHARTVGQQTKSTPFGPPLGTANDDSAVADRVRLSTAAYSNSRQSWSELDMGGQGLRALATSLFKYSFLTRLDIPHNALTGLPPAIGQLKSLEYLDVSCNFLRDLPDELGMLTNLKTLLLFGDDARYILPWSLGYLYKLEKLGVQPGVIMTEDQRSALLSGGTKGLVNHLLENMPDNYISPPTERPWHQLEDVSQSETPPPDTFKALTYNILCERYAPKAKYGYVPERSLNWHARRQVVLDEIRAHNADIVCLQELDRNSYDDFFRQNLSKSGYKGYYAQKSRAETIGDNARFVDGCGTFWKDKDYICLDTQHFVLGRKAVERPGAKASADMLNRVWQRDDIATVVFLENRWTGSRLIIGNSHVFWDPAYKDVKLIQVAVLMEELNKLAEKYSKHPSIPVSNKRQPNWIAADHDPEDLDANGAPREPAPSIEYSTGSAIPTLVCGDFNSGPGSPVYELMTKRALIPKHPDFHKKDYGSLSTQGMSHDFTLKSTNALVAETFMTNYTPEFADELDHIFYSANTLRPVGALGEVDPEYIKRVPGFPNQHFPSDHLALLAEFRVERVRNREVVEADFGNQESSRRR